MMMLSGFLSVVSGISPSPSTAFSFDSFRSSLLEIVTLEGWIDVMAIPTSIADPGQQPWTNMSTGNAVF
jgi:hypothetical protein